MNIFKLSWKYLTFKPLSTGLNMLLLALGLAIITVLLLIQDQFEKKMTQDAEGIDLVVGAKGSPLQIILSSVYHIDFPTGNIPMKEAMRLSQSRLVKNVIPLALGDNYQGYRVVGTNHDYLDLQQVTFKEGKAWERPFEMVLGAVVAEQIGLALGDEFIGSHGISEGSHDHEAHAYKVVGILEPRGTVVDRLLMTSVESVWLTHDEEEAKEESEVAHQEKYHAEVAKTGFPDTEEDRDVTSLLLQYRSPMAAVQLPRMINSGTSMQAASPSFEMSRLFELLGVGVSLLQGLAIVLIGISGLGIFIALYNSLKERKYDLAILRAIGASKFQLMLMIFLEGLILTFLGAVLGILLGHSFLAILISQNDQGVVSSLQPWIFLKEELWIVLYALAVGVVASLIPAWTAYQTSIAKQLTKA
ncbi:MAG: ABC transporter permease [Bacteroidota bacterium]|uniref:Putative ABC transport system permease protein n=1 Tax=Algoriphagus faecimaris TaxID=686796 RepID=A0A1G6TNF7_9BACT|nr:FtsX-like permease family protein [Algoriphagus faecimaris]SDD29917.1 putative ABC transport system permease protein [Algoriphagus faecimaris]